MIGNELSARYHIMDRIGEGGMAIVYKANDVLLNRHVAIKVLRKQYVHDEEFIRRFRREAQSAAALSHPNIVSVYDVGKEDDIHYIVMEYIEGSTLRERIISHAPFPVEEAVHIATQICDALDHAHHNQIIHRDIKPHNILIGRNGRVKVTDFGIARAATAIDITQTGSVVGSVHYFSPEHAKGVSQGESSDLYSLGIVMYQMLTNALPFHGESPISVALKHLQDKVRDPREINPHIPQSVGNIILKALRKAPEERYDSAHTMLEELESCLLPEKRDVPKIQFDSDDEYDDAERTLVMPAIRSGQRKNPVKLRAEDSSEHEDNAPFAELYEEDEGETRHRRVWIMPLVWVVILALAAIFGWMFLKSFWAKLDLPQDVPVPNVVNETYDRAQEILREAGLKAGELEFEHDDTIPEGIVIAQDPIAGYELKEDSEIKLTISDGPKLDEMQDYVGERWVDVELRLLSLGLRKDQIQIEYIKDEAPSGTVIAHTPEANEQFNLQEEDLIIQVTISEGLGTVDMPSLIESKESEVEIILEKYGLKLDPDIARDASFTVPEGQVYHQHPEPGEEVGIGESVKIWISSGYPEDALSYIWNVVVWPEVDGEPSTVRIIVRDALGENERAPTEISSLSTFPVPIVVSKDTSASFRILVNDKVFDQFTKTHQDVLEAMGQGDSGEQEQEPEQ